GQVPGRRRPQSYRHQPPRLPSQLAEHPVSGRRLGEAPARLRAVHSQRPYPASPAAPPVPNADQPVSAIEVAMSLTAQDVQSVAHLAGLQLSDGELETMTRQLSAIVDYVDQLKQVITDGVEPMAHALAVQNIFRDDEPSPSLPVADALSNAPQRRGDFYSVPAVLD